MLNKCLVQGRFVSDPQVRYTQDNTPVCSFTLAVDRDFKKGAEKQTDFLDICSFGATAEFIGKTFTKGRQAVVVGRLQIRDWTDKNDNKRRTAEIMLENIYFGDSRPVPLGETRSVNVQFEELDDSSVELPF